MIGITWLRLETMIGIQWLDQETRKSYSQIFSLGSISCTESIETKYINKNELVVV